jgi:hypothetical protein
MLPTVSQSSIMAQGREQHLQLPPLPPYPYCRTDTTDAVQPETVDDIKGVHKPVAHSEHRHGTRLDLPESLESL